MQMMDLLLLEVLLLLMVQRQGVWKRMQGLVVPVTMVMAPLLL
jgi:hypothetical protein